MSPKSGIFAVAVLGLLLSGCSSSSDISKSATDTSQPTSVSSPSTPAPSSSAPTKSATAEPSVDSAAINIQDFVFEDPAPVAPGAEITVTNEDSTSHTVTSSDGAFDVTVEGGATATFTAPSKPGEYAYVCNFHGDMTGTLVVK